MIHDKGRIVVDASAIGALLFGEPKGIEMARAIQGKTLYAPVLLGFEVASIFLKKRKLYPTKAYEIATDYSLFSEIPFEFVDTPVTGALEVALTKKLTIYDACYVWLALELNMKLLTLDQEVRKAVPGLVT